MFDETPDCKQAITLGGKLIQCLGI